MGSLRHKRPDLQSGARQVSPWIVRLDSLVESQQQDLQLELVGNLVLGRVGILVKCIQGFLQSDHLDILVKGNRVLPRPDHLGNFAEGNLGRRLLDRMDNPDILGIVVEVVAHLDSKRSCHSDSS